VKDGAPSMDRRPAAGPAVVSSAIGDDIYDRRNATVERRPYAASTDFCVPRIPRVARVDPEPLFGFISDGYHPAVNLKCLSAG
jgi:hypothetical protein